MPKSSENAHSQRSSQMSQESVGSSQLTQTQQPLDNEDFMRFSRIVANFFLTSDCKKIPVKKSDVAKLVPREYSRKIGDIISASSTKLQDVFGYKIIELSKKGTYLMLNTIDVPQNFCPTIEKQSADAGHTAIDRQSAIVGLRTAILAMIFMNGGEVNEGVLKQFLGKFMIDVDSKEYHDVFGNVNKLVYQDFVRQCYLDVHVVKDVDPPFKEIQWGERSKLEVNKRKLLNYVCEIYGDDIKPEMWLDQLADVNRTAPTEIIQRNE